MKIKTVKTEKIKPFTKDIFEILDRYLPNLKENSIVAITSKIISICEGSVAKMDEVKKEELIKKEAEYYLPPNKINGFTLTLKNNFLIATAGIDESNAAGYYILWPKNPLKSANSIRKYLMKKYSIKKIGVLITDSKTTPLRRGTTGFSIAFSGFIPLKDYIGKPDLFGRLLKVTQANIVDALAATATLVMGEGKEQTPIAIIQEVPFVRFKSTQTTKKELNSLNIPLDEDLYAPILKAVKWRKGKS